MQVEPTTEAETRVERPIRLRARPGHVVVRPEAGLAQRHHTHLVVPEKSRSLGYFFGRVVAVGDDVTEEIVVGALVLVDRNSAALTLDFDEGDEQTRLVVVRCGNARPAPRREDELAYRMTRLRALQKVFPKTVRPPWAVAELDDHYRAIEEIKKARKRWGRSRLFNATLDPGLGEGVVAVIEEAG